MNITLTAGWCRRQKYWLLKSAYYPEFYVYFKKKRDLIKALIPALTALSKLEWKIVSSTMQDNELTLETKCFGIIDNAYVGGSYTINIEFIEKRFTLKKLFSWIRHAKN